MSTDQIPATTGGPAECVFTNRADDETQIGEEAVQLVCFRAGERQFAVEIGPVKRILRLTGARTRLDSDPEAGAVFDYQGVDVPLVDIGAVARESDLAADEEIGVIVCESESGLVGLITDEVTQILRTTRSSLKKWPASSSDFDSPIKKMYRQDEETIYIIDDTRLHTCNGKIDG